MAKPYQYFLLAVVDLLCIQVCVCETVRAVPQVTVSDPFGKWTPNEIEAIRLFKQQWFNEKSSLGEGSHVSIRSQLTEKQLAWFYSLGQHRNGQTASRNSRRRKRQVRAGTLPPNGMKAIRREIRQMSAEELEYFTRAVNLMKISFPDPDDSRSEYDIFVELHRFRMAPGAHNGAAFLPWHREYLWRLEQALRTHYKEAAIPYWDSSLDQPLPNPSHSVLWTSLLLGNTDGAVFTGPFANFRSSPWCESLGETLTRSWRNCPNPSTFLFMNRDLEYVMNRTSFSAIAPNMDTKFEDDHGAVHVCIGGHMASVACAPADPVFFLHHAFIDCQWEEFRQRHQRTNLEEDYPTDADGDIGGPDHDPYAIMEPFSPHYNIHGISDHYTKYYYECANRPVQCRRNENCGSDYLWCDTRRGRCVAKVKAGGDCTGLPDDACHGVFERCINNVCGAVDNGSWWRWYNK